MIIIYYYHIIIILFIFTPPYMLHGIKVALANAPTKIYDTAKQAVDTAKNKVGSFNQRFVKPNINAAKDQLISAKNYLKLRFEDKGSRTQNAENKIDSFKQEPHASFQMPELTPINSPKDWNCTVGSFDKDIETLRKGFESKNPINPKQAYEELTVLAGNIRDAKELGSVLNLMDDILKGDPSIKDLKSLQDAIVASPLKGDAYTLNHVKAYFSEQTKNFSDLDSRLSELLKNALDEKRFK